MRVTDKKIEEAVVGTIGPEAVPVAKFLKGKKDVSEFAIEKAMKTDIQLVRNILYQFYENNLVSYKRKKDRVKGWYVSYWTFNNKKVLDVLDKIKRQKLEKFRERLEMENSSSYYICPSTCQRVEFGQAVQLNFRCTECGNLLMEQDNQKTIAFLREKIKEMEASA